jgi:dTDP-4-amino-4,6-dideoxygalactose transaminase
VTTIPFNRPTHAPAAAALLDDVLQSGKLSGDGPFTRRASETLSRVHDNATVLLTTSCTHALEMSAILLDLQPGDEVIVPSFTFVSTANAYALRGATPVFVDVRPDTLNLDEDAIERAITPRTKAIAPVHYAGVGCNMKAIGDIAARHQLMVIEDNAHGLFGSLDGRPLGTFGAMSTLSFHETKNLSTGEGGALVINDPDLVERAEIIREKGTNRTRFFRGQVDKYTWVDIGSSYLPSELIAAVLVAQLEIAGDVQARRERIWRRYDSELADWAGEHGVVTPTVPAGAQCAWHMYYLLLPDLEQRTAFIDHLKQAGIMAVFHYLPLHASPMGRRIGRTPFDCPVVESVADRLVRLPFYTAMTADEQERVLGTVRSFRSVAGVTRG